ncbi:MAG TPA: hypothetical protein VF017_03210 [Thermoanaerobaculia bacterium]|nr:hypothetical protein [Thermoanaerobaculia bacterium]
MSFVLMLGVAERLFAQAEDEAMTGFAIPQPVIIATEGAPVERSFYTGTLNWYWQPGGASTSITGSGYSTTTNGGRISGITVCLYNESLFSRQFRATASVIQGSTTIQAITFSTSFQPQQASCHSLFNLDATVLPGEFRISSSFNLFDADNIFAGIPTTSSGQTFDISVGSQRPPVGSGPQGPVTMKGIGLRYRIAENDAPPPPPPSCVPDSHSLCLNNGRFRVEATYHTASTSGAAQAVTLTDDTGYLWFFDADNVEAVVKVLNACGLNSRYWVFVAGLTDQGVDIVVTDTLQPDNVKLYSNPLGQTFVTITDTEGLDSCP